MDESVEKFFAKNAGDNYAANYDRDHGPRLDNLISHFGLQNVKNSRIVDIGGGLGFLGKRLDHSNEYHVIDGAVVPLDKRLVNTKNLLNFHISDLDRDKFGEKIYGDSKEGFDYAFCLETLEHLTNPYNCLTQTKAIVKENGEIYISIPHENVTHNAIYPGLLWPRTNFEQFLGQMALPIIKYHLWDKGWNCHTWKVRNAPWEEAKMLYPKNEEKFKGKTPVEYVNL